MYIRTKEGQFRHDNGVAYYAEELRKKRWSLFVDLPKMAKPPRIGNFIPDIYAQSGIREIVVEIETSDSVNSEHALLQTLTFYAWAKASSTRNFYKKIV